MSDDLNAGAAPQNQFSIQRIYSRDLSFEAPNSPEIFLTEWKPDMDLNLRSTNRQLDGNVYEVVLTVTVDVKVGDKTAFLVEVHQAGVFLIAGFNEEQTAQMLGSFCLNVLFPYARETVSDLVTRGGFPQLVLAPVNFDALYAQHLEQQNAAPAESSN